MVPDRSTRRRWGKACEHYSHIYRRARGLYISPDDRGRIGRRAAATPTYDEPRVIVITDNEAILGIGDQGVGGMPIAIGKLALYTVGAGIHPAQCLPLDLDVGTEQRRRGWPIRCTSACASRGCAASRTSRCSTSWSTPSRRCFRGRSCSGRTSRTPTRSMSSQRYRRRILSFNDDIQGTGAVVVAGIQSALRQTGGRLEDERVVFYGAGASGAGSALAVRAAMREAGVADGGVLRGRVLCLDSQGLILAGRAGLEGAKREIARRSGAGCRMACQRRWLFRPGGRRSTLQADVLVGASGQPGAFTEAIVHDLVAGCPRPIVLALSNPERRPR